MKCIVMEKERERERVKERDEERERERKTIKYIIKCLKLMSIQYVNQSIKENVFHVFRPDEEQRERKKERK